MHSILWTINGNTIPGKDNPWWRMGSITMSNIQSEVFEDCASLLFTARPRVLSLVSRTERAVNSNQGWLLEISFLLTSSRLMNMIWGITDQHSEGTGKLWLRLKKLPLERLCAEYNVLSKGDGKYSKKIQVSLNAFTTLVVLPTRMRRFSGLF